MFDKASDTLFLSVRFAPLHVGETRYSSKSITQALAFCPLPTNLGGLNPLKGVACCAAAICVGGGGGGKGGNGGGGGGGL